MSTNANTQFKSRLKEPFIQLLSKPEFQKGLGIANSALKAAFGNNYPNLVPLMNDLMKQCRLMASTGPPVHPDPDIKEETYWFLLTSDDAEYTMSMKVWTEMLEQRRLAAHVGKIFFNDAMKQLSVKDYNKLLVVMKEFKYTNNKAHLVKEVSALIRGHERLIAGFKAFVPGDAWQHFSDLDTSNVPTNDFLSETQDSQSIASMNISLGGSQHNLDRLVSSSKFNLIVALAESNGHIDLASVTDLGDDIQIVIDAMLTKGVIQQCDNGYAFPPDVMGLHRKYHGDIVPTKNAVDVGLTEIMSQFFWCTMCYSKCYIENDNSTGHKSAITQSEKYFMLRYFGLLALSFLTGKTRFLGTQSKQRKEPPEFMKEFRLCAEFFADLFDVNCEGRCYDSSCLATRDTTWQKINFNSVFKNVHQSILRTQQQGILTSVEESKQGKIGKGMYLHQAACLFPMTPALQEGRLRFASGANVNEYIYMVDGKTLLCPESSSLFTDPINMDESLFKLFLSKMISRQS